MTTRTLTGVVLILFAAGLVACTGSPSSPSAPSAPPLPTPSDISGLALDTGGRAIAGAAVEVLDGPQAGLATTSDVGGRFSLTGIFDGTTRFRASKDGYVAAVQTIFAMRAVKLTFSLALVGTPVDIAGEYTVTFIADSACADLPNEVRARAYPATVTANVFPGVPANTQFFATLKGANLDGYYRQIFIQVAGNYLAVNLSDNFVLDEIAEETYFAVSGYGSGSVTSGAPTISTTFSGSFDYCVAASDIDGAQYTCPSNAVAHAQCQSKNHQIILTRR